MPCEEVVLSRQQHLSGLLPITCGDPQPDRFVGLSSRQIPIRSSPQQPGDIRRGGRFELAAQDVPEEPVVAVPLAVDVQWDDEQVGPFQCLQDG